MDEETRENIRQIVENLILDKVKKYDPESKYKPFHSALFSEEDLAKYSLLHSFSTSFGMSAYEQIAVELARGAGYHAEKQYELDGKVDHNTQSLISKMCKELKKSKVDPDRDSEVAKIKDSIEPVSDGNGGEDPDRVVDVYIRKPSGEEYYFDITTVKPNKKEYQTLKRKLMKWMGLTLSIEKDAEVYPRIAIPYNPDHPEPYSRWTKSGLYDKNQLMIGRDFWELCAGEPVFDEILEIFEEVGEEMENILDDTLDEDL